MRKFLLLARLIFILPINPGCGTVISWRRNPQPGQGLDSLRMYGAGRVGGHLTFLVSSQKDGKQLSMQLWLGKGWQENERFTPSGEKWRLMKRFNVILLPPPHQSSSSYLLPEAKTLVYREATSLDSPLPMVPFALLTSGSKNTPFSSAATENFFLNSEKSWLWNMSGPSGFGERIVDQYLKAKKVL